MAGVSFDPITVALVGLGKIGWEYDSDISSDDYVVTHSRAVSKADGFNLVGGVDISAKQRDAFSSAYDLPAFESIQNLSAQFKPDIWIVSGNTESHLQSIIEIIEFSPPRIILCEKPMGADLATAIEIMNLCKIHEIELFVNYVRRADPGVKQFSSAILLGEVGFPFYAHVVYSGGLLNTCSHFIDLLMSWFGPIITSENLSATETPSGESLDPDFKLLFSQGVATFCAHNDVPYSNYSMTIYFQNGKLEYRSNGAMHWHGLTQHDFSTRSVISNDPQVIHTEMNLYQLNIMSEIDKIFKGESFSLCTAIDALSVHKVLDEIILRKRFD